MAYSPSQLIQMRYISVEVNCMMVIISSVDIEIIYLQLPDYHEIIEHPMDFGTVRKKLDGGLYSNLEELEVSYGLPHWNL